MRILGIVMAKKGSVRVPGKNVADVCGKPSMAYAIESLIQSGACDSVIVATNSAEYGAIGVKHGALDYVIRDSSTDQFTFLSMSAQDALLRWEKKMVLEYDAVVTIGANCIFLRPSWIRVALKLIENYAYRSMPIEVVTIEENQWLVNVCRVKRGIATSPHSFVLRHSGMFLEIDWEHELNLARDIQKQINDGAIYYPLQERVHEEILKRMSEAPNHMTGLTPLEEL